MKTITAKKIQYYSRDNYGNRHYYLNEHYNPVLVEIINRLLDYKKTIAPEKIDLLSKLGYKFEYIEQP